MFPNKIILDLCGGSGAWSKPYAEAGYDVRLITLPFFDVRDYIPPNNVYGILAAPPCTEFSFAKHYHGKGNYSHDFKSGLAVADACIRIIWRCRPKWWALENPMGYLKKWYGEPSLVFHPWEYGDNYSKKTCIWGDFTIPTKKTNKKPDNVIKFSLLKSREIHPEYFGILSRTERRAITPAGFAKSFFEANK